MNTRATLPSRIIILLLLLTAPRLVRAASARGSLTAQDLRPDLSAIQYASSCDKIITSYLSLSQRATDPTCKGNLDIAYAFCSDPILSPAVPQLDVLSKTAFANCQPDQKKGLLPEAALGGLQWQQDVISGVAAFLVSRAKAEAIASFATQMQEDICTKGDGEKLLPLTCSFISTVSPYDVPVSWTALKGTLENDLQDLPYNYIDNYVPPPNPAYHDTTELLKTTIQSSSLILKGEEPLRVLSGLEKKYRATSNCTTTPASCGMLGIGIAVQIIGPGLTENFNPDLKFLEITTRLFLEEFKKRELVAARLDTGKLTSALLKLVLVAKELQVTLTKAREARTVLLTTTGRPEGAHFADAVSKMSAYLLAISSTIAAAEDFAALLDAPVAGFQAAHKATGHVIDALDGVNRQDYTRVVLSLLLVPADLGSKDTSPVWLKKYGPFLAQLATAKDPESAQQALEAMALPVGSYRQKRGKTKEGLTLSINGYLGVQGGMEWLASSEIPQAPSAHLGLFAPIGIEASVGLGEASSLGLLFTIIDVGALTDFRLKGSSSSDQTDKQPQISVDQAPTFGFAQVFSPGLYAVWGIHKVPLVLGIGASMTPELRRVSLLEEQRTQDVSALRFAAFLAVDVTILAF
ncbi:hypothetical protein D7W79_30785 [Corallococcus exercitus]|uniref:hypothetical protein n=1 Tax=Corallococcus exercitus TaxID=2316736 RepID=UPI000EA15E1E|nr:hypothetical protein [Corallococcus exercitus]RKG71438.1 hypothetical protein D7W79_30785 [Corallococcus exercitus]